MKKEPTIRDFEIMAPAGSFDSLTAAIQGGANAVYFGIEGLNMRARSANNFTIDDLKTINDICRQHNMNSYLTVNTILYDNDLALMKTIINAAKKAELSAIIASDVAAMIYARQIGVDVHLSTQLNITNIEALKFYAQFADVVVLARELVLEQVAYIYQQIQEQQIRGPKGKLIRIEMFCHGALCMAVSGKCYLSLHEGDQSANRGACMQFCRRGYIVKDKESETELEIDNQYIMSPKDLKTIHFMNKMIDAGVRVFKIEGRARGAEYVRTVTSCYKEAIHAYLENKFTEDLIQNFDNRLSSVFNRGFWNGYYLGERLGQWSHNYGSQATRRKIYIGKCTNFFSKLSVAEFLMETQTLNVGDEILITGPTTGAVTLLAQDIRVDLKPTEQTKKGEKFSTQVPERIRPGDKLFKWVPIEIKTYKDKI